MRELEPRLGQRAVVGTHIGPHPPRGVAAAVPQQPVEPRDMVLLAQHAVIALQQRLLLEDGEVAVDPHVADARLALILAAGIDPDLRLPQLARGGHRREAVVPIGNLLVGDADGRFVGVLAQHEAARPVRIGGDELADLGEGGAAAVARQVEPPQHLGEKAVLRLVGAQPGGRPVARTRRLEGLAVGLTVVAAQLRLRRRREHREEGQQD